MYIGYIGLLLAVSSNDLSSSNPMDASCISSFAASAILLICGSQKCILVLHSSSLAITSNTDMDAWDSKQIRSSAFPITSIVSISVPGLYFAKSGSSASFCLVAPTVCSPLLFSVLVRGGIVLGALAMTLQL